VLRADLLSWPSVSDYSCVVPSQAAKKANAMAADPYIVCLKASRLNTHRLS